MFCLFTCYILNVLEKWGEVVPVCKIAFQLGPEKWQPNSEKKRRISLDHNLFAILNQGEANMSIKQTKSHIKDLKKELKTVNQANDLRLLKLFVLMILLAAVAALIHGRINFFML